MYFRPFLRFWILPRLHHDATLDLDDSIMISERIFVIKAGQTKNFKLSKAHLSGAAINICGQLHQHVECDPNQPHANNISAPF